jgi:hypothetical protein
MNEEPIDDSNINIALPKAAFQHKVKRPTHMRSCIIDHISIPQHTQCIFSKATVYPCHFSDYDSVSISIHFPPAL